MGLAASGCSTTPPPRGLTVVEPAVPPPTVEQVEAAQRRLAALSLYFGTFDGELDAETRVAIARFQRERGLDVTGALDPGTWEALGGTLEPGAPAEEPERPPELELPSARELLAEAPPLPQPPAGALDAVHDEVDRGLLAAASTAEALLARAEGADLQERLAAAERAIAAARREGFERLLQARRQGGWALLPEALQGALRRALAERNLLLRPEDAGWGRDEAAAIRWLGHSIGMPARDEPSLELLEALGIDPAPMFQRQREVPNEGPHGDRK